MDAKVLALVFFTAFIAELGDKSQVLTVLFVSNKSASPLTVFLGVSLALVLATGIGVLAGHLLSDWVNEKLLSWVAGTGFLLLGGITIFRALQHS
ncbi:TMEM165/GDT1 family protein [Teredinibacter purpureus]|jgi:Predicted membrane protein|uniref:TMEM165/GDT1 family protein n=1 Tax=Teredinibacter purpureus TaxID=2731756 RepID=UPI0005F83C77|nr:TMEM165/GDT1 family protein [Teredinibacter purpureus]